MKQSRFVLLMGLAIPACLSAALSVDVQTNVDAATAVAILATPAFSTTAPNELLLAFIASDSSGGDNTAVTSVSGAGLNWTLVQRTNAQSGTAEIWRAFAHQQLKGVAVQASLSQSVVASLTVVSVAGADKTSVDGASAIGATGSANASSGGPYAGLTTTRDQSMIFGVGNDYDNAIARTPGTNQRVIHQLLSSTGDTYWTQMQIGAIASAGTPVAIDDTAPTGDRYNLSVVEILADSGAAVTPSSYTIAGTVVNLLTSSTASVSISPAIDGGVTTTDSDGNFSFSQVPDGAYTLTPRSSGFTFTPPSATVTVRGGNVSNLLFAGVPVVGPTASAWAVLNRYGDYGNDELQCYTPGNVSTFGGYLNITALKQSATCGDSLHPPSLSNYTSGMVQWQGFNFRYGTLEVSAKMPGGLGAWPAIWLLGANCQASNLLTADNVGTCDWPNRGSEEIDFLEFNNYAWDNFSSVDHNVFEASGGISCSQNIPGGADASQGFHTYSMTWLPGSLSFSVDGVTANCGFSPSQIPASPMFLMINNAIISASGCSSRGRCPDQSQFPQQMQVDYVRVWDQKGTLIFDDEFTGSVAAASARPAGNSP